MHDMGIAGILRLPEYDVRSGGGPGNASARATTFFPFFRAGNHLQ